MMAMHPINDIDRQAAEWVARIDGGELSAAQQAAFDAWMAEDIRHVGAYAKATAVLAHIERSRAIGLQLDAPRGRAKFIPSRRQLVLTGSVAASLAIVAVMADLGREYLGESVYSTVVGGTKVVPLSDGSVLTLNTDTKVAVRYTNARRSIALMRGEVLFDVAKNRKRPFVVGARDAQMRAVGTSFSVRLLPDRPVEVLVQEGVVEIKRPNIPAVAPILVGADRRAIIPDDAPITTVAETPAKVARDLAWRVGRIAFDDMPLSMAASEFARYSSTRIVIEDPAVARRTVTGLFVSNDPVGFARAVALSLGLDAKLANNEVRLLPKTGDSHG